MKNELSSSKGLCIGNFTSFFSQIYPAHLRSVYDPNEMILTVLKREVPHMFPAKYQHNRPSGCGQEII